MGKIVGFDIGENSVKMAYFVGNELRKTACEDLPDAMMSDGRILSMDAMADFLREMAGKHGIPSAGAAMTLPTSEIITRELTMPAMTEQQLNYNLPYEFHDFLTEEKSKYFFDYSVREIRRDADGCPVEMELFACAMRKADVEAYRAMFRRAGFKLKVLTPAECAYGDLIGAYMKRTGEPSMDRCIVNLGHTRTRLYTYRGSESFHQREIDLGLSDLDEIIAEQCGVDVHVAHGYKETNYNGVLESEYALEFYSRLAVEVMKAVNFYHYNNRDRELKELYFCGGGAAIRPLCDAITKMTKLTSYSGERLFSEKLCPPDEPWQYLRAIGGVNGGIRGGLE